MVHPALSHPLDHCGFTPMQNRPPSADKETQAQKDKVTCPILRFGSFLTSLLRVLPMPATPFGEGAL